MAAPRTARERARAELTVAIKDEARRQLAGVGASALSLRAVSRELGMVSSALYRYFPSRDDLLTALIVDAYDALGTAVEDAVAEADEPAGQWRALCHAMRNWARAHPHEYLLIYGTPVPGYEAPRETVASASRIPHALLRVLHSGWAAGVLHAGENTLTEPLREQVHAVERLWALDVPDSVLARGVLAWAQLSGMIGFELNGHFVGGFEPADDLFAHSVEEAMRFVGLSAS